MKKKFDFLKGRASFIFIALIVIVVIVLIIVALAQSLHRIAPTTDSSNTNDTVAVDTKIRHPLTGEVIEEAYTQLPQLFAIMVENSADAWPLSGVNDAFLVIEAPAEGDIPRFLTFFSDEMDVAKIGPVRSARPYYVEWATPFDAVYGHVGGSPEGLDLIAATDGFTDLNQFYQGEYYWRQDPPRYAPHNVYTSTDLLRDSLDELQLDEPMYTFWKFKDDAPVTEGAKSISVDWTSGTTYDVDWDYRPETNDYVREQGGVEYTTNNVVVMATDMQVVDEKGRKHIRTTGEGDALFVQDGEVFLGVWKKESQDSPLKFYTYAGDEISMNAGKTWIEVVRDLSAVTTRPVEQP